MEGGTVTAARSEAAPSIWRGLHKWTGARGATMWERGNEVEEKQQEETKETEEARL